ncbi:MAG: CRTAC1 family protein [Planctomycetota bacterium]
MNPRLVLTVAVALLAACGREEAPTPAAAEETEPLAFARRFVDVTEASGLDFVHHPGGTGRKYLPETMGSGAAFLDYDGDGVLDVFLVDSGTWPGGGGGAPAGRCALYRGLGGGRFRDVTEESGAGLSLYGMGCCAADFDGDGDPDLYITALGPNVLLRNDGGVFRDVTAAAGVAGGTWSDAQGREQDDWSTAAAFLDVDGDGDLDLFVANYCQWTPELDCFATFDGRTKVFTTPDRYVGLPCRLFLNSGDGTFLRAGEEWGLDGHLGKALGLAQWDFDGDGRPDVVVANDTRPNFLFLNREGRRFDERGRDLGIAYDEYGRARAGMGIDVADYGNDGVPGVAIGNFAAEPISLYRWGGIEEGFAPDAARAGLAPGTLEPLAFGLVLADLDLDGRLDLAIANGHIEPEIERFFPPRTHAQPAQVFLGRPEGRFREVPSSSLGDLAVPRVGRGLAVGDVDGDGDLDFLLTENGGRARLFENRAEAGTERRSLRVRLRQEGPNRDALGAVVTLEAASGRQTRVQRTGSSYLSQSELVSTFGGLAEGETVRLVVRWPDGVTEERSCGPDVREILVRRGGN